VSPPSNQWPLARRQRADQDLRTKDETDIDLLFPLGDIQPPPVVKDMGDEELLARSKRVQGAMTFVVPRPKLASEGFQGQEVVHRLGDLHQCFKQVNELEGPTKRLYEVAAETAGLALEDFVKAVYSLEKMMISWQKREKRRLGEPWEA